MRYYLTTKNTIVCNQWGKTPSKCIILPKSVQHTAIISDYLIIEVFHFVIKNDYIVKQNHDYYNYDYYHVNKSAFLRHDRLLM